MGFRVILSKELKRVFGDKKMIFSMFILPVLLIGGMFMLMFTLANKTDKKIEEHRRQESIINTYKRLRHMLWVHRITSLT